MPSPVSLRPCPRCAAPSRALRRAALAALLAAACAHPRPREPGAAAALARPVPPCDRPAVDTSAWPAVRAWAAPVAFRLPPGFGEASVSSARPTQIWSLETGWELELRLTRLTPESPGPGPGPIPYNGPGAEDQSSRKVYRAECELQLDGRAATVATYVELHTFPSWRYIGTAGIRPGPTEYLWLVGLTRDPAKQAEFLTLLHTLRFTE